MAVLEPRSVRPGAGGPPLAEPRQLPLPLGAEPSHRAADFVGDASNADARAFLARPDAWPDGRLALHGPAGVGKTHLSHILAQSGWAWLDGMALRGLPPPPATGTIIDDADLAPEAAALFHAINASREAGCPLLLLGRLPPARWHAAPPDLVSRLRATTTAAIAEPSDALLAALLAKHLADRQLALAPPLQSLLLLHLPRDAASIARAVALLDAAALATGRLGRSTILAVLRDSFVP